MRLILLAALAASLSACSTVPTIGGGASAADALKTLGEHMDKCERDYQGSLGVGASFNFKIHCAGDSGSPGAAPSAAP